MYGIALLNMLGRDYTHTSVYLNDLILPVYINCVIDCLLVVVAGHCLDQSFPKCGPQPSGGP